SSSSSACRVFSPLRFKEIMAYRTVTAQTFRGLPLADFTSAVRGSILESLVIKLDQQLHPGSVIRDAVVGQCVTGARRGRHMLQYDWLRDGTRVECKSAQLVWNKHKIIWVAHFRNCF
ncbi:unnamed protein product, partial [Polarella glacialis]